MAKMEIRIKYCFCCDLTIATIFIAVYCLLMYCIFLGLASWSAWRIDNNQPDLQQSISVLPAATIRTDNKDTVIVFDTYFDSLGLYTEELKYSQAVRYPVLVLNILIFCMVLISSALILVGLCTDLPFLLLPWIASMSIEVIRGFISCIMIFVLSESDVRKIALGIFFLGLQLFHISLILIVTAKFQQVTERRRKPMYKVDARDMSVADSVNMYPTLRSNYAFGQSPQTRQPGCPQPRYDTYHPEDYGVVNKYGTATMGREYSDRWAGPSQRPGRYLPTM